MGFGLKISTHRYINPNGTKTRAGADPDERPPDELPEADGGVVAKHVRLYPEGKGLRKGESAKELRRPTQDAHGGMYPSEL